MELHSHLAAELCLNPSARHDAGYGRAQARILNAGGLEAAKAIIGAWPGYQPTPLVALPGLAQAAGVNCLHYKDEAHRFGLLSFKPLGGAFAVARMLMRELPAITGAAEITIEDLLAGRYRKAASGLTVTAATDGNHGRSVAWGADMFGCRCVIFINEAVSQGRQSAIAAFGAEVRRNPGSYDDAVRMAKKTAREQGWHVIADTSDNIADIAPKDVTQGYAVMAAETIGQLPYDGPPSHIFLQAGVGGMAAATVAQFWQHYGPRRPFATLVEPATAACWFASLKAGHPVSIGGELKSIMGGLACGEVSHLAWEILHTGADAMMTIEDAAAGDAMRLLVQGRDGDPAIIAGESGVAGLAGFLAATEDDGMRRTLGLDKNARIVVFGTEGATDPDTYAAIVGHSVGEMIT